MNIKLLLHTVYHLRLIQVVYQVRYRLHKPLYRATIAPVGIINKSLTITPIARYHCLEMSRGIFSFLNKEDNFKDWNDIGKGMLWAYNLNYMDWLNQEDVLVIEGIRWIERFIKELPDNRIGLNPYPIALRGVNWMKFILLHREEIGERRLQQWNDSLYAQYMLLNKTLEYHLMGNHLLEDVYSLYMASLYFEDKALFYKISYVLLRELKEQILPDGAHYEQSPMYHCILLDRLLDCYNFSKNIQCFPEQEMVNIELKGFARRMLGHLESIIYIDGTIPLLNDAAYGIAPEPKELFVYAKRLNVEYKIIPMRECGYRKMRNKYMEAIVDIGNIMASYQPGHTHADTFNYELRIGDKPFIVDTGISTYNKNNRRQYERSTAAHNTLTVNGLNSNEVWDGFRLGKRAKVTCLEDTEHLIRALHDGFGKYGVHTRTFQMEENCFIVTDRVSSEYQAVNYIHLAPEVQVKCVTAEKIVTNQGVISLSDAQSVEIADETVSTTYNLFLPSKTVKILFTKEMRYTIGK
ncbi:alginate lyase family protein [uncultured Parabacteroides sp.]|uniref:alginate lyase family protein n=1 Tax=uncultured Parabacteroides sp. TaxID=512312 RepID=UPI00263201D0|nr:alginate lyase family protein [uncultured Parabacteroides sp.]